MRVRRVLLLALAAAATAAGAWLASLETVSFDGAEVGAVEPRVAVDIEPASIEVHCPVVI